MRPDKYPWEISRDGNIVRIDFLSSPDRQDMLDLMDALDTLENSELRMFVMEKAPILLSTAEVREGAEIAKAMANQPRRIAVVAPGEITFGISRIFKVYRESENTEFEVFREETEAKAWLLG